MNKVNNCHLASFGAAMRNQWRTYAKNEPGPDENPSEARFCKALFLYR